MRLAALILSLCCTSSLLADDAPDAAKTEPAPPASNATDQPAKVEPVAAETPPAAAKPAEPVAAEAAPSATTNDKDSKPSAASLGSAASSPNASTSAKADAAKSDQSLDRQIAERQVQLDELNKLKERLTKKVDSDSPENFEFHIKQMKESIDRLLTKRRQSSESLMPAIDAANAQDADKWRASIMSLIHRSEARLDELTTKHASARGESDDKAAQIAVRQIDLVRDDLKRLLNSLNNPKSADQFLLADGPAAEKSPDSKAPSSPATPLVPAKEAQPDGKPATTATATPDPSRRLREITEQMLELKKQLQALRSEQHELGSGLDQEAARLLQPEIDEVISQLKALLQERTKLRKEAKGSTPAKADYKSDRGTSKTDRGDIRIELKFSQAGEFYYVGPRTLVLSKLIELRDSGRLNEKEKAKLEPIIEEVRDFKREARSEYRLDFQKPVAGMGFRGARLRKEANEEEEEHEERIAIGRSLLRGSSLEEEFKRRTAAAHRARTAESEKIEKSLDRLISLKFVDTPLSEVIRQIGTIAECNVFLDAAGLEDVGQNTKILISHELNGLTLRSALNVILEPLKLGFLIDNEVLKITSAKRAAVDDLVAQQRRLQGLTEAIRNLQLIDRDDIARPLDEEAETVRKRIHQLEKQVYLNQMPRSNSSTLLRSSNAYVTLNRDEEEELDEFRVRKGKAGRSKRDDDDAPLLQAVKDLRREVRETRKDVAELRKMVEGMKTSDNDAPMLNAPAGPAVIVEPPAAGSGRGKWITQSADPYSIQTPADALQKTLGGAILKQLLTPPGAPMIPGPDGTVLPPLSTDGPKPAPATPPGGALSSPVAPPAKPGASDPLEKKISDPQSRMHEKLQKKVVHAFQNATVDDFAVAIGKDVNVFVDAEALKSVQFDRASRKSSILATNISLGDLLDLFLLPQGLTHRIDEDLVVITTLDPKAAPAQMRRWEAIRNAHPESKRNDPSATAVIDTVLSSLPGGTIYRPVTELRETETPSGKVTVPVTRMMAVQGPSYTAPPGSAVSPTPVPGGSMSRSTRRVTDGSIERQLKTTRVTMTMENSSLYKILMRIGAQANVRIEVDNKSLGLSGDAWKFDDRSFSIDVKDVPASKALFELLDPYGLSYVVKDGSVTITTRDGAASKLMRIAR